MHLAAARPAPRGAQGSGSAADGLAKKLEKPQSYVSKYESGERRLDLLELEQVCRAIGIQLKVLVERFEKA